MITVMRLLIFHIIANKQAFQSAAYQDVTWYTTCYTQRTTMW